MPRGREGDSSGWKYMLAGPLRGWTTQHSGALRTHSLWVRTDSAWYWLRIGLVFAPATMYKLLWTPPGSDSTCPLPEDALVASPVAFAYARSVHHPPRGSGAARSAATALAPYAESDAADAALSVCPRSFRLANFELQAHYHSTTRLPIPKHENLFLPGHPHVSSSHSLMCMYALPSAM